MRKLKLQELKRVRLSEFKQQTKLPVTIVLDNIRSGLNVGSAFRTGDAFAVEQIYLCGITAQPPHREILKTAIGATESVHWQYHQTTAEALKSLQQAGYACYAVEQTDTSISLEQFRVPEKPLALVFGNEVEGVDSSIFPYLDGSIEVPQFGTKHSLNVSVCLGVVLWECLRQYRFL